MQRKQTPRKQTARKQTARKQTARKQKARKQTPRKQTARKHTPRKQTVRKISRKRTLRKRRAVTPKVRKLFGGADEITFYDDSDFVIELNGENFDENNKIIHEDFKNKPGIVMFYVNWCGHCSSDSTKNLWKEIGKLSGKDVIVGAMNCNNTSLRNNEVSAKIGIRSYPSIAYINIDGTVDNNMFNGNRTKPELFKFICNKVRNLEPKLPICEI